MKDTAAELAFVIFRRLFQNGSPRLILDNGGIYDDIWSAHGSKNLLFHPQNTGKIAYISCKGTCVYRHFSQFLHQIFRPICAMVVVYGNVGSRSGQGTRHDPSQFAGSAGDYCQFPA